eukprot:RCo039412
MGGDSKGLQSPPPPSALIPPPPPFYPAMGPPPPMMPPGVPVAMTTGGMRTPTRPMRPEDYIHRVPFNTVVCIVPQGQLWVVERFGKYSRTLSPGLWFLVPFVDRIGYVHSSKESAFSIPNQSAITKVNVIVEIDGVMFMKIVDAVKASYNIDNAIYNLIQMAQTTMRSEIGKLTLDTLFEERTALNANIVQAIKKDAQEWGVECKRYEIKDILVSDLVRQSMDLQAEAERRKRKLVLESEGQMLAVRNHAEGQRVATELMAEAERVRIQRVAQANADAIVATSEATARALQAVSASIHSSSNAKEAMALRVAEQYVAAFGMLAKEANSVILPANLAEPSAMIAQALGLYTSLSGKVPSPGVAGSQGTAAGSSGANTSDSSSS